MAWQQRAARLFHVALYLWLLAMPLLGWLLLSAEGHDISFFGLPLPGLTAGNRDLAERVKEIHETIGTLGYVLIGAHTAAALFHHHVQKDNTLLRMLPQRR